MAILLGLVLTSCGGGGGDSANSGNTGSDNGAACSSSASPVGLPVITLQAGSERICAEVASTQEQRERGLMNRQELAENAGMLFDFSEPTSICMWMKDTVIPLSVAFIGQNGVIVNIEDLTPQTTDLRCSSTPARYALEMNRGWFSRKNVTPGSGIASLP